MARNRSTNAYRHSVSELRAIRARIDADPYQSALAAQVASYAKRTGGLTLEFWRLFQGPWFNEPWVMTLEGCAERLRVPVSELVKIGEETAKSVPILRQRPEQS